MSASLTVIGLGKLGLPLAAFYASRGATVRGVDRDERRVRSILERTTTDLRNEEDLLATIERAGERLTFGTDTVAAVRESDHVLAVVPVIASGQADVDFTALDVVSGSFEVFSSSSPRS